MSFIRFLINTLIWIFYDINFSQNTSKMHWKLPFKNFVWVFKISALITTHNFMKINITTPNYTYYDVVRLNPRYEYSIMIIFHNTYVRCFKNCCSKKLFGFMKNFGRTTTHNFVQMKIITPDYAYYKIVLLKLRYEYSTTLILRKTKVRCIKNCCLNQLFEFFIIFCRITPYNFVQIKTISPN
jgi:hypothetical protein